MGIIALMLYLGGEAQRSNHVEMVQVHRDDDATATTSSKPYAEFEWDLDSNVSGLGQLYQERRKVPIDFEAAPYNSVTAQNGAVLGEDFAGEVGAERVVRTESSPVPQCTMETFLEDGEDDFRTQMLLNVRAPIPEGRTANDYSRMHEQIKLDAARYNKGAMHCDLVRRVRCAVGSSVDEKHLPVLGGASAPQGPHTLTKLDDPVDYAEFPAPQRVVGSQGEVRGRALVLYNMHGWAIAPDRVALEWGNLAHFLNVGYFPGPTELFDGVDYVFMRSREGISEVTMCAQHKNVKFVWVPTGPCDLCAHAKVLAYLGYKPEYSDASSLSLKDSWATARPWLYKSIVLMNSGVRGPFHGESTNSPWIDVVSMAGRRSRPLFLKDDRSFKTVYAPVVSWEKKVHAQSYFLVAPLSALGGLFNAYLKGCKGNKWNCILTAEMQTLEILLNGNFYVYASLQEHTFKQRQLAHLEKLRFELDLANRTMPKSTNHNPSYKFNDPCRGIFIKFGGKAVREKLIDKTTLKAGFQVSALMERHPWALPLDINEVFQSGPGNPDGSKCSLLTEPPKPPAPTSTSPPPTEPVVTSMTSGTTPKENDEKHSSAPPTVEVPSGQ